MSLDPRWWRAEVVRPALLRIGLHSESAEVLVTGTAIVESDLDYLRQIGGGPALGPYQVEPATHRSLWVDLLRYREPLAERVASLLGHGPDELPGPSASSTTWAWWAGGLDLALVVAPAAPRIAGLWWYATAIARVRYLWDPPPLPAPADVEGMAETWVRGYNAGGKGTVAKAIPAFRTALEAG